MSVSPPFHLAFAVTNIEATRAFYVEKLGCKVGRSAERWVDFDFFGHQLVIHLNQSKKNIDTENIVDGKNVPVPHFGIILDMQDFNKIASRLLKKEIKFIIEPTLRFKGEPGEQKTMFFKDPFGNALEFKSFKNDSEIFKK